MNRISETPATALLRKLGISWTEHVYDYVEHGGFLRAPEAGARAIGVGCAGVSQKRVPHSILFSSARSSP